MRAKNGSIDLSEKASDPLASANASEDGQHREQQRVILEVASRALENASRDPDQVLAVARNVGLRAHLIENLRAYATRAIFRVKPKPQIAEEQMNDTKHAAALIDLTHVDKIEARILVRELLEQLPSDLDRAIFTRLMNGQTCREIDASLELKPRTAEIRVMVCKNALRRAVESKLRPSS